jgi:hypothetical protein
VADPHRIACLEFAPNAGWWGCFAVADATWEARVKAAFRLLADSGFGGERSRGWGRAAAPEFSDASSLLPGRVNEEGAWWLLSMYSPDASDAVDWSRGEYGATERGGWTDSQAGVAPKKHVRVIEEGSVLFAPSLRGRAVDVAPEGFAHPVYRAGFALAVPAPPEPAMRPAVTPKPAVEEMETPAEIAEEVEAEAEMVYEGGPPEPPARAEAEPEEPQPEPAPEPAHEPAPETPPASEPIEQPIAAPERESESTGSSTAIEEPAHTPEGNVEQDTPERSESTSVETDTQGSSEEELL